MFSSLHTASGRHIIRDQHKRRTFLCGAQRLLQYKDASGKVSRTQRQQRITITAANALDDVTKLRYVLLLAFFCSSHRQYKIPHRRCTGRHTTVATGTRTLTFCTYLGKLAVVSPHSTLATAARALSVGRRSGNECMWCRSIEKQR